MGYTITIGQLRVEKNPEDGVECSCIGFDAEGFKSEAAPAFGEPTDFTNSRWPSYSAWAEFMRDSDMYDFFFTEGGHLIGGHPGVRLVTPELAEYVGLALAAFKIRNPSVQPIFSESEPKGGTLCRLIWLDYWLRWSLANCETPVIANS